MRCYVLTGGRSRRMGQSKTALFANRVFAAAREAFDEVIAVDRAFEPPHEGEGAIFGLHAALRHAQHGRCFILAVDYPLITADVLRWLAARGGVPVWRGEPQPLCAAYDASLLPLVERRIAAQRLDLRGLLAEARIDRIPEAELRARFAGEPLLNVNTPEELEEAGALDERLLASR
jgi:molybdopterin-guanine dinucleotide biosynthesis protein A